MTARLVLAVTTAVGLAIAMVATTGPPPRYSPVVLRVDDRRLLPRNAPQVIDYRLEFVGDVPIPGGYAGGRTTLASLPSLQSAIQPSSSSSRNVSYILT